MVALVIVLDHAMEDAWDVLGLARVVVNIRAEEIVLDYVLIHA